MTKKVYALVVCLTGAVCAAATGLVTYFNPPMATAINASIMVIEAAVAAICSKFIKD